MYPLGPISAAQKLILYFRNMIRVFESGCRKDPTNLLIYNNTTALLDIPHLSRLISYKSDLLISQPLGMLILYMRNISPINKCLFNVQGVF